MWNFTRLLPLVLVKHSESHSSTSSQLINTNLGLLNAISVSYSLDHSITNNPFGIIGEVCILSGSNYNILLGLVLGLDIVSAMHCIGFLLNFIIHPTSWEYRYGP